MSVESAKEFIAKLKSDDDFRKQVVAAETAESRIAVVKSAGFDFTQSEYDQAVDEVGEPIGDEELDDVAGGCFLHGCKFHIG